MSNERRVTSQKISPEELQKELQNPTENSNKVSEKDKGVYLKIEDLPSEFKRYEIGTEIWARPLKVLEVKMLSQMTENTADEVVNEVLRRTIKGIEVEDLLTTDKLYLVFWLRANTYKESGVQVEFECPKCEVLSNYTFSIDDLNIKKITEKEEDKIKLGLTLSNSDVIRFKFLTVKDEQENKKFLKQNEKSIMHFDQDILSVCKMIETINSEQKGMIEKYTYLTEEISAEDYARIESFIVDITAGLEPYMEIKCNKCKGVSVQPIPFRGTFFLPKTPS